jgi:DNA-binding transcriptional MerR regulator
MDMGIGEISQVTGIKIPTIRYYEQIRLLPEAVRTEGNRRRYDHGAVHRLLFIRRARDLGFGIDAIRDLFRLADVSFSPSSEALHIAKEQLVAVKEKIAHLKAFEEALKKVIALAAEAADGAASAQLTPPARQHNARTARQDVCPVQPIEASKTKCAF